MPTIYDTTNPRLSEIGNAIPFSHWLLVLASPDLFHMLARQPSREHLLWLCDAYMPYARSRRELAKEQGYVSHAADESQVSELAERMRSLLAAWDPNNLTPEIIDTARALLLASQPFEIHDWSYKPDLDPGETLDDILVWPSGNWMPQ